LWNLNNKSQKNQSQKLLRGEQIPHAPARRWRSSATPRAGDNPRNAPDKQVPHGGTKIGKTKVNGNYPHPEGVPYRYHRAKPCVYTISIIDMKIK